MINPGNSSLDPSFDESTQNPSQSPEPDAAEAGDVVARLTRERDEYLLQLQRERADFVNYQKRVRNQMETDKQYAVSNLVEDLLPVLDNFERALEAARSAGASSIVDGLTLVHRQLLDTLAKHGVEPIAALGLPFDPNEHEAISQRPDPNVPDGTVVGELARGYKLRDRVLRPSRVVVSAS